MPVLGTTLSSYRPLLQSTRGMVVASHPAAAQAGLDILQKGGNAVDAGVAVGIALNVVHAHECNFLGVAPAILYMAARREVVTYDGLGVWPRAATLEHFQKHHKGAFPRGIARSLTPGAVDTWFQALRQHGTMRFEDVAAEAIRLADEGFPVYRFFADAIRDGPEEYSRFPTNAAIFLPGGRPPSIGELFYQKDLAATLAQLVDVERKNKSKGREGALQAAREVVYTGDLARRIVDFCRSEGGLLTLEDLAAYQVRSEPAVTVNYRGYDLYATGPWGQGPVLPQALKILEGFDLKALGHNSASYIHTVTQALNLAFSDREKYMGDPAFVDVPMDELLAPAYLAERRKLIDPQMAWPVMPPAGDPRRGRATFPGDPQSPTQATPEAGVAGAHGPGTSYFGVIDGDGNLFSCTPSEGAKSGPIVPGTGMSISVRGSQSKLESGHPAALGPGKRPRLTPAPALVLRGGHPVFVLGGYGGDHIPQGMLQIFLNVVEFGMDPQEAVEAARFYTYNFPGSTHPWAYRPGLMRAESRIPVEIFEALRALGHKLDPYPDWWEGACLYALISRNSQSGVLQGGADPRGESYAVGY